MARLTKQRAARQKVGLALGGGGARGYIEVGAIKAFAELGVRFDVCAGTSSGAFVGALYAAGLDADEIEKIAESVDIDALCAPFALSDPKMIGDIVGRAIGDMRIEDFPIPFAAVATDIGTGRRIALDRGKARDAVAASAAYPGCYRPVKTGGLLLADGAASDILPVDVCKALCADSTVAVDISGEREVAGRALADVLIAPDLSAFWPAGKRGYREMIELGLKATLGRASEIAELFSVRQGK